MTSSISSVSLQQAEDDFLTTHVTESTIVDKNNETNDKFYRKVAFFMYMERLILGLKKKRRLSWYPWGS